MKKLLNFLSIISLSMSTIFTTSACSFTGVNNAKSLQSVLANTNLGVITTNGQDLPVVQDIINKVQVANSNESIQWSDVTVGSGTIKNNQATLTSTNQNIYTGTVVVNYTIDSTISLKTVTEITGIDLVMDPNKKYKELDSIIAQANEFQEHQLGEGYIISYFNSENSNIDLRDHNQDTGEVHWITIKASETDKHWKGKTQKIWCEGLN